MYKFTFCTIKKRENYRISSPANVLKRILGKCAFPQFLALKRCDSQDVTPKDEISVSSTDGAFTDNLERYLCTLFF